MDVAIIPSVQATRPVPRFAFHDSMPEVFGLDDELQILMVQYANYLHDLTGKRRTLGELAQGLTMQALSTEDTWNFWGWMHRAGRDEPSYRYVSSTWPLTFAGFSSDVE